MSEEFNDLLLLPEFENVVLVQAVAKSKSLIGNMVDNKSLLEELDSAFRASQEVGISPRIVVNLGGSLVDADGLTMLKNGLGIAQESGGNLVLASVHDSTRQLLIHTGWLSTEANPTGFEVVA